MVRRVGKLGACLGIVAASNACAVASVEEEPAARKSSDLYLTGHPRPNKMARVCWDDAARQRPDFAEQSVVMQSAANRMYTQATGLQFFDWGVCPAETAGVIVTTMLTNQQSHCGTEDNQIGYVATKPTICAISTGNVAIMHEYGHALGFAHEWQRADWTLTCRARATTGGNSLGTPANDSNSILAAMGYCTTKQRIDYWDVVGAQKVYGFPNMFADVSGDGKADALVVRADGVYVRTANTANTGFNTEVNWAPSGPRYGDKGTFLADVSGDAKSDLVLINDTGVIVRRANTSVAPPTFTSGSNYTGEPFWGTLETHVADVTGDCLADVIAINDTETYVRDAVLPPPFVEAGSFGPGWTLGPSRVGNFGHTVFANVSHPAAAKGCWADAIYIDTDGVWVAASNGTTLSNPVKWINGGPTIRPIGYAMRAVLVDDVTQDGLADIVEVGNDEIYVWRSLGNAFADPPEVWNSQGIGQVADRGAFLADVTNDLRADLILVGPDRIRVAKSNGSAFPSYSFWTATPYYGSQLMF